MTLYLHGSVQVGQVRLLGVVHYIVTKFVDLGLQTFIRYRSLQEVPE
jgi:hypothetical protein